ncbi:LacI family DNA-binding transcriptional regulator [Rhizobium sp. KVB221]|uniref:LacI family DNA-binding transcriptional regulator n=1 Tax=Rhizobium setariae TaxID=2801340 RepID=A0A936YUB5_9HYPH|nr:LacI family DNA-binding transcriptional regulator [Rhizobium setariae]MBL0372720.1 LacI family DNA-binding transcriptional regulator [Rhizobium setariae]
MAHDFLIKDIAFQAGLSPATVDRVINGRSGVRRQTVARVEAAILELRQQENSSAAPGRSYAFDVVMETPDRFSSAVRAAFESEAASFRPVSLRSRFHFSEQLREYDMIALLNKIRLRGSHGVVLKAADTPAVTEAVDLLYAAGIPVITLVTDLPHSRRIAYAGSDNRAAGETAAFLIGSKIERGDVLVTLSSSRFRGEEEREIGFRRLFRERWPSLGIVELSEGYGRDRTTGEQVHRALAANPSINSVYSIGGGNRAIVDAFRDAGRQIACFVGHDLDQDNIDLLRQESIHFVLHHNLNSDAASVFRTFLKARHGGPLSAAPALSALAIITPFNIPP